MVVRSLIKVLERLDPRYSYVLGSAKVELDPPDVVVDFGRGAVLSRVLLCKGVNYGVEDLPEGSARSILDAYAALIRALPSRVFLLLYKEELDMKSFMRTLKNSILNIQADIELATNEAQKLKLKLKLDKLKSLYNAILEGKPFIRVALAVVIRVEAKDKGTAKSIADYYESLVLSVFKNHFGLELEKPSRLELLSLVAGILGIDPEPKLPRVEAESTRLAVLQPIDIDRPLISEQGVLVGFEKETRHPVSIPPAALYQHMAIIGPTGRGKSTFLASLIEQVVSEGYMNVIAIDFKGDLKRYLADGLLPVLSPEEAPISALAPPPGIDELNWRRVVVEAFSYAGGLSVDAVVKALATIAGDQSAIYRDPSASVIVPFAEFINSEVKYERLQERLNGSLLVDLENRGTVYQNTYASLFVGIVRYMLMKGGEGPGLLLVVDDAWRLLRLKILLEIVREGRSKKVGVVLSSQNPDDYPDEILENVSNILVFGSPNDNYLEKVKRILGIDEQLVSTAKKLGVGEAIYLNTQFKYPKVVSTFKPLKMRSEEQAGALREKHSH